MLWTSGEIFLGFNVRVDQLPTCNGFLRFTLGVTPAELLMTRMAAKPLYPITCTPTYKLL